MPARSANADAARVTAAFFVVLIHAAGVSWPCGISYNALARFGVPVFVILSGYFMLSRAQTVGSIVRRSGRLLVIMVCWSALYYAYILAVGERQWEGAETMLRYLVTEPVHMWYIYTAVFLYAITPLLYVFCAHATRRQYEYAMLVLFGLGSVYELMHATAMFPTLMLIAENAHLPWGVGFVLFYLLGGYLRRWSLSGAAAAVVYAMGALGAAMTVAGSLALSHGGLNELLFRYTSPNVVLTAAAFTLFFLRLRLPESRRLGEAARCTLGVYLLHPLLIMTAQHLGIWEPETLSLWIAIPLRAAAVFALSMLASLLLSRAPLLRKLVS